MCEEVREIVDIECVICRRTEPISFYSNLVCKKCHECPECGTPAYDCLQTEPYICIATVERRIGVKCTKCGASWADRRELDRALIHKSYTEAKPICRVCGKDVYHGHETGWGKQSDQPCICEDCLECPTCRSGVPLESDADTGAVYCPVCKSGWDSARAFEHECRV